MTIPEAVELVLQAASIGNGGEIFILDMGKPIRIAEMAEDLITLMGHVPGRDIKVQFTGLRSGEKLYEELFFEDFEKPTLFEDIRIGRSCTVDWEQLERDLGQLMGLARQYDTGAVMSVLRRMVPEYKTPVHTDATAEQSDQPAEGAGSTRTRPSNTTWPAYTS